MVNKKNIPETRIKVIGFGNIFMSDDGLGIKAINLLKDKKLRAEIIDGGTSAADLILHSKTADKIIVIDAVDAGQNTGEVIKFSADEIIDFKQRIKSFSLHDFDLSKALAIIRKLGIDTEIIIIGIKPKVIDYGHKITPAIRKKIPEIVGMVIAEINN